MVLASLPQCFACFLICDLLRFTIFKCLNLQNRYINFTMKDCQHHLKTFLSKRLTFIVIIRDMQPNKTILYNMSEQTLVKKQFPIKELIFGKLYKNTSKINLILSLTKNSDHLRGFNMNEWPKNVLLDISFSIKKIYIFTLFDLLSEFCFIYLIVMHAFSMRFCLCVL